MAQGKYTPGQKVTSGLLLRRIFPHPNYYDGSEGRPTRQVFDKKKGEHLSAAFSDLTNPEELLVGHDGFGLCEITVEALIAEGLDVTYEPSEEEGDAHVAIRGALTGGVRHRLSRQSRCVIAPTIQSGPTKTDC